MESKCHEEQVKRTSFWGIPFVILFIIMSAMSMITACSKSSVAEEDAPIDCSGPPKSYVADVSPIIQTFCATNSGCHGTGSNNGPGPLTSYTQVFNARSAIRAAVASGEMPKNGTLTAAQKSAILCWIDSGANDN